jgi:hypothetical protein
MVKNQSKKHSDSFAEKQPQNTLDMRSGEISFKASQDSNKSASKSNVHNQMLKVRKSQNFKKSE